ncbi:DUF4291 domain-containing protein [Streptomyces sp. K1PN6]|uniref:DUF4291 domain-containing protein n=1 Tax=Streptomyces acidicola TaxID=2596892 RepID=A0A5N8WVJ6_9ACTN|nr:DUF4291 domain-containing protein [Streptomyces acidicola]
MEEPQHRISAAYAESTITVYQAYSPAIGLPAVREDRFPAEWTRGRTAWIKPDVLERIQEGAALLAWRPGL